MARSRAASRVAPGAKQTRALRHLLELSASATSTGSIAPSPAMPNLPDERRRPGAITTRRNGRIRRRAARDAFARWDELERRDPRLPRSACSARPCPARSSMRRPATLALLRTATVIRLEGGELWGWEGQHIARRLVRGHLHPCLELPAGAVASLSGARAHAARDRIHLQPTADRRPDVPPEAAARLRLRHHRPLRRRAFRRDHQDLSRMEACRATTPGCKRYWPNIKRAIEYAWSPDNPDRWDPERDRHPVGPPAPDARHGAVRPEFLARLACMSRR